MIIKIQPITNTPKTLTKKEYEKWKQESDKIKKWFDYNKTEKGWLV